MIERLEKRSAFLQRAKAIKAHGVEPFEDVAIFAVLRRMAVLLDKALNFLKSGDDALLARGAAALLLRLSERRRVRRAVRPDQVTHSAPHP